MIPGAKPNSNGTIDTKTDQRDEIIEIVVEEGGWGGQAVQPGSPPDLGNKLWF